MGWFYPSLNFFIIVLVYFVFIYNNLFAQMQLLQQFPTNQPVYIDPYVHRASTTELVLVAVCFHVSLIMFLLSMSRAILTPPGTVPPVKVWRHGFYTDPRVDAKLVAILSNENYAKKKAIDFKRVYAEYSCS